VAREEARWRWREHEGAGEAGVMSMEGCSRGTGLGGKTTCEVRP
jgi:hypothetical protein